MSEKEYIKYIIKIDEICNKFDDTIKRDEATKENIDLLKKWINDNISKSLWLNDYV